MLKIDFVRPAEIDVQWNAVGPMLDRAIEVSRGTWDLASVRASLVAGLYQLWLVSDDGDILATMVTGVQSFPAMKVFEVLFLAGHRGYEWGNDLLETIERTARHLGCARVWFRGRREWSTVLKPSGYEPVAVCYEKVLACNGSTVPFHS